MKPLILKRNTWHHWLIRSLGGPDLTETDICTYTAILLGAILKGLILLGFAATALGGLILLFWSVGHFLAWFAVGLLYSWVVPLDFAFLGLFFLCLISGIALVDWFYSRSSTPPSFLSQAFSSFKERVCWKVRIEP